MKGRVLLGFCVLLLLSAVVKAELWQRIHGAGECRQRGTTSTCLLRLPEREVRDLTVDVPAGDQGVAFQLSTARNGSWSREAEGIWHASPVSRHAFVTINALSGPVRLELTGDVRPPRLAGFTASVGQPRLTHTKLEPAPRASRAIFPLESARFPAAWPVRADGVKPGDMVRLELPAEVLRSLGKPDRWGLRVATPEGQLPWDFEIADLPRPEAEPVEARWLPTKRPGWLRMSLRGLEEGPAYMEVQLASPPRPLRRRVLVENEETLWTCTPTPPLPCRLMLNFYINRNPPRTLPEIEIEAGAGNPLPPLEVSVWRRTESLFFVWPSQGPVRLLAGNDRVYSQRISLGEIDRQATARPWKPAALGPRAQAQPHRIRAWHLGGALVSALVLAGLCFWEWRRRLVLAALLLAVCLPAQALGAQIPVRGVIRERPVEVPAAGWVQVPLGLEILPHLGPDGQRLQVIGPDGEEVPSGVEAEDGQAIPHRSSRSWMEQGNRLVLPVDLGSSAPVHEQLEWDPDFQDGQLPPQDWLLEASEDQEHWRRLPPSGRFRIVEGRLADDYRSYRARLEYQPEGSRFIRLINPRKPNFFPGAQFTTSVSVTSAVLPEERTISLVPDCSRAGVSTTCLLTLPARNLLLHGITLELQSAESGAGMRLAIAHEGKWVLLAEGFWSSPGKGSRTLRLNPSPLPSEHLRLELFGESGPPRLIQARAHFAPAFVFFSAPAAGTYRLVYGNARAIWRSRLPGEGEKALLIEPGPERTRPLPPAFFAELQTSSGQAIAETAWPVRAPGAQAGDIVRLTLPADIDPEAKSRGLRLEAGGRQVPYIVHGLDVPRLEPGARMPARPDSGSLLFVPGLDLRDLTGLRLETSGLSSVPATPTGWGPVSGCGSGSCSCQPWRLLPCVLELGREEVQRQPQGREEGALLSIWSPSPEVTATLWRRRHELVFVWPGGPGMLLLAGHGIPSSPSYDLKAIEDLLLTQAWKPAHLGRGSEIPATTLLPLGIRWGLLALAAFALLAVIHFMMPRRPQHSAPG